LDHAYQDYQNFSKARNEWQPETKDQWAKKIHQLLNPTKTRRALGGIPGRVRSFAFAPLAECRRRFEAHIGAPIQWEPESDPISAQHHSVMPAFENKFTVQVR
jgi:hypothetical protein